MEETEQKSLQLFQHSFVLNFLTYVIKSLKLSNRREKCVLFMSMYDI